MRFVETPLAGAFVIDIEPAEDERGFFARDWCEREFAAHNLVTRIAQCSTSFNRRRGALRGMHYQAEPYGEAKVVRCIAGAIYDVIADIRPASPTYRRWFAIELSRANHRMLYVPEGFAHGFQTLEDDTEIYYQISEFYRPELARGIRWNDPQFDFRFPIEERIMSERDRAFPDFAIAEGHKRNELDFQDAQDDLIRSGV